MTTQATFPGTQAEWNLNQALTRLGKTAGRDFFFMPSVTGAMFFLPPDLALQVKSPVADGTGKVKKTQLAGQGITLIFIDENRLYGDARTVVESALARRDESGGA